MREYWVSAYTQRGSLFGTSIAADDIDEMFRIFDQQYPYGDIADYGEYEDDDWAEPDWTPEEFEDEEDE